MLSINQIILLLEIYRSSKPQAATCVGTTSKDIGVLITTGLVSDDGGGKYSTTATGTLLVNTYKQITSLIQKL